MQYRTENSARAIRATDGFTLVELMVVVAIVGVLSSIATLQYRKFTAKARQSEAKIALAAIFATETAFHAESLSYSDCLRQIGYEPSSGARYYFTGFAGANDGSVNWFDCGPDGTGWCDSYSWSGAGISCDCSLTLTTPLGNDCSFVPTHTVGAPLLDLTTKDAALSPTGRTAHKNSFSAAAAGSIGTSATNYDIWVIDELKNLSNINPGI